MVSVVEESTVQHSIQGDDRTRDKTSDNISTLNPTPKISSEYSSSKRKTPLCKYAANKQPCPFGAQCPYRHPSPRKHPTATPVCRHYLQGQCRYGNSCKFCHPQTSSDSKPESNHDHSSDSTILNLTDFPSISKSKGDSRTVEKKLPKTSANEPNFVPIPKEQKRVLHHHDGSQTAPVELQLEAFFKRAATITPKPAVSRPGGSKKPQENMASRIADKVTEIEETEVRLLQKESSAEKDPQEKEVYVVPFRPSDPEWDNYGTHTLQLIVIFPENYPEQALSLNVIDEGTLSKSAILAMNTKLDIQISLMHEESKVPSGHTPIFKKLLNWLDNNIVEICNKNIEHCFSEDSDDATSEDDEYSDQDSEESVEEDPASLDFLRPSKRGTEIRMVELGLNQHVATLQLTQLKMTVQCTRCKNREDVICAPEKLTSQACEKCQSCYGVTIHPDIVHPANSTLCFMDILGCKPVDVVLPSCEFTVACLECQKECSLKGLSYGEPLQTSCRGCHSRLQIFTENCKFLTHQPGPSNALAGEIQGAAKKKKKKVKDDFVIQLGKPLPEFGTCLHYKKSHRWLRFPCCGKAYPCDVCHDQSEDHPMERANRMICGFCSKEQGYTGVKPCILCGCDLANFKFSAYWEGGLGCRNKGKMNRNDPHKYKHDNKTVSKKDERVGAKGKKNRSQNHPSV